MYTRNDHFIINLEQTSALPMEYDTLHTLLHSNILNCSQAHCSELQNIIKATITKDTKIIRRILQSNKTEPFLFIHCLN